MPATRSSTGNSRPRVFAAVDTAPTQKRAGVKKTGARKGTAKANTSKPRVKKTTTGRVTKTKKSPLEKVKDKVGGAVLKAEGKVERKPGKKVCVPIFLCKFLRSGVGLREALSAYTATSQGLRCLRTLFLVTPLTSEIVGCRISEDSRHEETCYGKAQDKDRQGKGLGALVQTEQISGFRFVCSVEDL